MSAPVTSPTQRTAALSEVTISLPFPGPSVINAELNLFGLLSMLLHQDSNTAQQHLSHAGSQTISGCSSQEGSELHTC